MRYGSLDIKKYIKLYYFLVNHRVDGNCIIYISSSPPVCSPSGGTNDICGCDENRRNIFQGTYLRSNKMSFHFVEERGDDGLAVRVFDKIQKSKIQTQISTPLFSYSHCIAYQYTTTPFPEFLYSWLVPLLLSHHVIITHNAQPLTYLPPHFSFFLSCLFLHRTKLQKIAASAFDFILRFLLQLLEGLPRTAHSCN